MKSLNFDNYKFRASQIGRLMSGAKKSLTANQEKTLEGYKEMIIKHHNGQRKPLTPAQWKTMADLSARAVAKPELSAGAKFFLEEIWKEKVFNRKKNISTKYMDKGIQAEEQALTLVSKVTDTFLVKNKERKEDDFFTGECDNSQGLIRDIKNSWDYLTFPMHEIKLPSSDYDWQMHVYMHLWDLKQAQVIYTLVDTPEMLIEDEIRRTSWKLGMIQVPEELEQEIRHNMTYKNIPDELRVKIFHLNREKWKIDMMKQYVKMGRKYLNELSVRMAEQYDSLKEKSKKAA